MPNKELTVEEVATAEELTEYVTSLTNMKEEDGQEVEEQAMRTTEDAAREAIEIARFREDMGADDLLLVYPEWLTGESEWGETQQAIYAFGEVEFDGKDKRAVLFDSVREIDDNVIQNNAWSRTDVAISEVIDLIDLSEDTDGYVDDAGLMWIPRNYLRVVEVVEQ